MILALRVSSTIVHYLLILPCLSWPNEFDRAAPVVHKVPENVRVKAIPGLNVGFLPTVLPYIFVAEVRTYTLMDTRKRYPIVYSIVNSLTATISKPRVSKLIDYFSITS